MVEYFTVALRGTKEGQEPIYKRCVIEAYDLEDAFDGAGDLIDNNWYGLEWKVVADDCHGGLPAKMDDADIVDARGVWYKGDGMYRCICGDDVDCLTIAEFSGAFVCGRCAREDEADGYGRIAGSLEALLPRLVIAMEARNECDSARYLALLAFSGKLNDAALRILRLHLKHSEHGTIPCLDPARSDESLTAYLKVAYEQWQKAERKGVTV